MKLKDVKPHDVVKTGGNPFLILENTLKSNIDGFWIGTPVMKVISVDSPSEGAILRSYRFDDNCLLVTGKERAAALAEMITDIIKAYDELGGYADLLKDLE